MSYQCQTKILNNISSIYHPPKQHTHTYIHYHWHLQIFTLNQMATGTAMIWECLLFHWNTWFVITVQKWSNEILHMPRQHWYRDMCKFCCDHTQTWILRFRAIYFCTVSIWDITILLVKHWPRCLPAYLGQPEGLMIQLISSTGLNTHSQWHLFLTWIWSLVHLSL